MTKKITIKNKFYYIEKNLKSLDKFMVEQLVFLKVRNQELVIFSVKQIL